MSRWTATEMASTTATSAAEPVIDRDRDGVDDREERPVVRS